MNTANTNTTTSPASPIDWSKPVQTRDGRKVRVLATDAASLNNKYPVVVLVTSEGGYENVMQLTIDGRYWYDVKEPSPLDLVNVPEKRRVWVAVGQFGKVAGSETAVVVTNGYESKEKAIKFLGSNTRAVFEIEYTEGQGLGSDE